MAIKTAKKQHPADARRNAELAKIHLAKRDMGLDEETYREMLWTVAKVHSAGDLDSAGRRAVLDHLFPKAGGYSNKPKNMETGDRAALLQKIEAQLAEAGRPWVYATGMAKNMFKIEKVEWCKPEQLRKIVAALTYDAKRHGRRTK